MIASMNISVFDRPVSLTVAGVAGDEKSAGIQEKERLSLCIRQAVQLKKQHSGCCDES